MSDLVAEFPTEAEAEEVRQRLLGMLPGGFFDETKEEALQAALAGVREAQAAVAGPASA